MKIPKTTNVLGFLGVLALTLMGLMAGSAYAAPSGGRIEAGAGNLADPLNIQQESDTLTTSWQSFDIAKGEVVRITQPSASSLISIKVRNDATTNISGTLTANGRVSLENPAGIRFNEGSVVNVGGLLASARAGDVVARGSITSPQGKVHFQSLGSENVVNIGGAVQASRVIVEGVNEVRIASGADIRASKEVLIGGDYQGGGTIAKSQLTYIEPNTSIIAPRVIVWSDDTTFFEGKIDSTQGSNEGFVEISGKETLGPLNLADIKAGELLIDPSNIVVRSISPNSNSLLTNRGGDIRVNDGGSINTITPTAIQNFNGRVILRAGTSITITDAINKTNGSLTLSAPTITFNSSVSTTGALTIQNVSTMNFPTFGSDTSRFLSARTLSISGASTINIRGSRVLRLTGSLSVIINSDLNQENEFANLVVGSLTISAPTINISSNITTRGDLSLNNLTTLANTAASRGRSSITLKGEDVSVDGAATITITGNVRTVFTSSEATIFNKIVNQTGSGSLVLDGPRFNSNSNVTTSGDLIIRNVLRINFPVTSANPAITMRGRTINISGSPTITIDGSGTATFNGTTSLTIGNSINKLTNNLILDTPTLNSGASASTTGDLILEEISTIRNSSTLGSSITLGGNNVRIEGGTTATTLSSTNGGAITLDGGTSITIDRVINQTNGVLILEAPTLNINRSITSSAAVLISEVSTINFPANTAMTITSDVLEISSATATTTTFTTTSALTLRGTTSITISNNVNKTNGALTINTPTYISDADLTVGGNLTLTNLTKINDTSAAGASITLEGDNITFSNGGTITVSGRDVRFVATNSITINPLVASLAALTFEGDIINVNNTLAGGSLLEVKANTQINFTTSKNINLISERTLKITSKTPTGTTIVPSNKNLSLAAPEVIFDGIIDIGTGTLSVLGLRISAVSTSTEIKAASFSFLYYHFGFFAGEPDTLTRAKTEISLTVPEDSSATIRGAPTGVSPKGLMTISAERNNATQTLFLSIDTSVKKGVAITVRNFSILANSSSDTNPINMTVNVETGGNITLNDINVTMGDLSVTSQGSINLARNINLGSYDLALDSQGTGKILFPQNADITLRANTISLTSDGTTAEAMAGILNQAERALDVTIIGTQSVTINSDLNANAVTLESTNITFPGDLLPARLTLNYLGTGRVDVTADLFQNGRILVINALERNVGFDFGNVVFENASFAISALDIDLMRENVSLTANVISITLTAAISSIRTTAIEPDASLALTVNNSMSLSIPQINLTTRAPVSGARFSITLNGNAVATFARSTVITARAISLNGSISGLDDLSFISTVDPISFSSTIPTSINTVEDLSIDSAGTPSTPSNQDLTLSVTSRTLTLLGNYDIGTGTLFVTAQAFIGNPSFKAATFDITYTGTADAVLPPWIIQFGVNFIFTARTANITPPRLIDIGNGNLEINAQVGRIQYIENTVYNAKNITLHSQTVFADTAFTTLTLTASDKISLSGHLTLNGSSGVLNLSAASITNIASLTRNDLNITWVGTTATIPNWAIALDKNLSITSLFATLDLPALVNMGNGELRLSIPSASGSSIIRRGTLFLTWTGTTASIPEWSMTVNSDLYVDAQAIPLQIPDSIDIGNGNLFITAETISGTATSITLRGITFLWTGTTAYAPRWAVVEDVNLSVKAVSADISVSDNIDIGGGNLLFEAQVGRVLFINSGRNTIELEANAITILSAGTAASLVNINATLRARGDILFGGRFDFTDGVLVMVSGPRNTINFADDRATVITAKRVELTSQGSAPVASNQNLTITTSGLTKINGAFDIGTSNLTLTALSISQPTIPTSFNRNFLIMRLTNARRVDVYQWAFLENKNVTIIATRGGIFIPRNANVGSGTVVIEAQAGAINFNSQGATTLSAREVTLTSNGTPRLSSNQALTITVLETLTINGNYNIGTGLLKITATLIVGNPNFIRGGIELIYNNPNDFQILSWLLEKNQDTSFTLQSNIILPFFIDLGTGSFTVNSGSHSIIFDGNDSTTIRARSITLISKGPATKTNQDLTLTAIENITLDGNFDLRTTGGTPAGNITLEGQNIVLTNSSTLFRNNTHITWTGSTASIPAWAIVQNKNLTVISQQAPLILPLTIDIGTGNLWLEGPSISDANSVTRNALTFKWTGETTFTIPQWTLATNKNLTIIAENALVGIPSVLNIGTGDLFITGFSLYTPLNFPVVLRDSLEITITGPEVFDVPDWVISRNKDLTIIAKLADLYLPNAIDIGNATLTLTAQRGGINFNNRGATLLTASNILLTSNGNPARSQHNLIIEAENTLSLTGNFDTGVGDIVITTSEFSVVEAGIKRGSLTIIWNGIENFFIKDWMIAMNSNLVIVSQSANITVDRDINIGAGHLTLNAPIIGSILVSPVITLGSLEVVWKSQNPFAVPNWMMIRNRSVSIIAETADISFPTIVNLGAGHLRVSALAGAVNFDTQAETIVNVGDLTIASVSASQRASHQNIVITSLGSVLLEGHINIGTGNLTARSGIGGAISFSKNFPTQISAANITLGSNRKPVASNQDLTLTAIETLSLRGRFDIGTGNLVVSAGRVGATVATLNRNALTFTWSGAQTAFIPQWAIDENGDMSVTVLQAGIILPPSLEIGDGALTINSAGVINFATTATGTISARSISLTASNDNGLSPSNQTLILTALENISLVGSFDFGTGNVTLNAERIFILGNSKLVANDIYINTNSKDIDVSSPTTASLEITADNNLTFSDRQKLFSLELDGLMIIADNEIEIQTSATFSAATIHVGGVIKAAENNFTLTALTNGGITFADDRHTVIEGESISLVSPSEQATFSNRNLTIRANRNITLEGYFLLGEGDVWLIAGNNGKLGVINFVSTPSFAAERYRLEQNGAFFASEKPANFYFANNQIDISPLIIYTGIELFQPAVDWAHQFIVRTGDEGIDLMTLLEVGEEYFGASFADGIFDFGDIPLILITSGDIDLTGIENTNRPLVIRASSIVLSGRRIKTSSNDDVINHLILEATHNVLIDADITSTHDITIRAAAINFSFYKPILIEANNINFDSRGLPIANNQNVILRSEQDISLQGQLNIGLASLRLEAGGRIKSIPSPGEEMRDVEIRANRIFHSAGRFNDENDPSHSFTLQAANDIHLVNHLVINGSITLRAGGTIFFSTGGAGSHRVEARGEESSIFLQQRQSTNYNRAVELISESIMLIGFELVERITSNTFDGRLLLTALGGHDITLPLLASAGSIADMDMPFLTNSLCFSVNSNICP